MTSSHRVGRVESINPSSLGAPIGYAHGRLAPAGAQWLCIAGQIGWDADQRLVGPDLVQQFAQALRNVQSVLLAAQGRPCDLMRMTIYVVDKQAYLSSTKALGKAYQAVFGKHYPAMALVEVAALLEPGALVEVSADACIVPAR